jgi:ATP:ADP antiporter, AAA family
VWVSVFALYATSLVWSVLIDIFSSEQGKRLFGLIAGGATAGAISASLLAISTQKIGTNRIMLLSAAVLAGSCIFVVAIERATRDWPGGEKTPPVEGGMFSGIIEIFNSRYLTLMILFIALISLFGGMIYMRLTEEAKRELADYEQRTAYFAQLNLYVQLGTLFMQSVVIGPAMRRLGLSVTVSLLPCLAAALFTAMYFRSDLMMLGVVDVISRIATYGFSVPSREVLFTVVSREAKYKAKNIIDTIVIRGSDALSSSLYGTAMHYVTFSTLCLSLVPIAGLWYFIAVWLGRRQAVLAQQPEQLVGIAKA